MEAMCNITDYMQDSTKGKTEGNAIVSMRKLWNKRLFVNKNTVFKSG